MTQLHLLEFHYHGDSTQENLHEIRSDLEECYSRLECQLPERVEVQVFDTSVKMAAFLEDDKAELGITTLGDDSFICSHDAWRGSPRLLICIERLFDLPPLARSGTIRHEVAHTVLHGSPVYYMFGIPPDCLQRANTKGIDSTGLQQVLYYCATAVKDFEVTRLLLYRGYRDCQAAFAEAQFLPSREDELAWLLAKYHPQARLLFFTSQLKTLLSGWSLAVANLIQLEESSDSMLNYMEPEQRERLLGVAITIAKQLGEDTHDNVRLTLRHVLQDLL